MKLKIVYRDSQEPGDPESMVWPDGAKANDVIGTLASLGRFELISPGTHPDGDPELWTIFVQSDYD